MQINRKLILLGCGCLILGVSLYFSSNKSPKPNKKSKIELLSESAGYLTCKVETKINPLLDVDAFIRGFRSYAENSEPPLAREQMEDLAEEAEYEYHQKSITKNLASSCIFLSEISQMPNIITLVENELYYEILSEGHGQPLIIPSSTYLFHYTVSIPPKDKILFDTREKNQPQSLCLDCVIPGFAQGVLGMKVKERRKLYIHPNLGYRCMHWTVPPNTALVIDVELVGY